MDFGDFNLDRRGYADKKILVTAIMGSANTRFFFFDGRLDAGDNEAVLFKGLILTAAAFNPLLNRRPHRCNLLACKRF